MTEDEEKQWIAEAYQDLLVCPICNTPYYGKVDYDVLGCQNECSGVPISPGSQEKSVFDDIIFYYKEHAVIINRFEFNSKRSKYNNLARILITNMIPFESGKITNEFQLSHTIKNVNLIFDLAREKKLEKICDFMLKIHKLLPNDRLEELFVSFANKDIDWLEALTIFT